MAPTNYKTVFKVDYAPWLSFYDKMFAMASSLPDYPDWMTNGISVTLQNMDDWCSFALTMNWFIYIREIEKERSSGADDVRIKAIIEKLVPQLDRKDFQRMGLRSFHLCPVDMKFQQLVTIVAEKFLLDNKDIRTGICPEAIDAAYAVHFADADLRVALRVGPVKRGELEAQLAPNRLTNVPPNKRSLPGEELFGTFPEVSLLMDIDVFRTDFAANELASSYESARNLTDKLSHNIASYVFGLKG